MLRILPIILLMAAIALVCENGERLNNDAAAEDTPTSDRETTPKKVPAPVIPNCPVLDTAPPPCKEAFMQLVYGMYKPSLEMKENTDFLITPAMLVQESLSKDVIPTYPHE